MKYINLLLFVSIFVSVDILAQTTHFVTGGGLALQEKWNDSAVLSGDIIEIADSMVYSTSQPIGSSAADDNILIRASVGESPTFQPDHNWFVNGCPSQIFRPGLFIWT